MTPDPNENLPGDRLPVIQPGVAETERAPAPGVAPRPQGRPKRPSAPFTIGITLIVGGALMCLAGGVGMIIYLWMSASDQPLGNLRTPVQPVLMALSGAQFGLSVVAIVAGAGLVGYRAWGRVLSLVWAVAGLVEIVVSLVVNFAFALPAARKMLQGLDLPADSAPAMRMGMAMSTVMTIISSLALTVVPILVLILMTRSSAKQSCT